MLVDCFNLFHTLIIHFGGKNNKNYRLELFVPDTRNIHIEFRMYSCVWCVWCPREHTRYLSLIGFWFFFYLYTESVNQIIYTWHFKMKMKIMHVRNWICNLNHCQFIESQHFIEHWFESRSSSAIRNSLCQIQRHPYRSIAKDVFVCVCVHVANLRSSYAPIQHVNIVISWRVLTHC